LPMETWLGMFLYDRQAQTWTNAVYPFREDW